MTQNEESKDLYKNIIKGYMFDVINNGPQCVNNDMKNKINTVLTYHFIPSMDYNIGSDIIRLLNDIYTPTEINRLIDQLIDMIYNYNISTWIYTKLFIIAVYINTQQNEYLNDSFSDFMIFVIYQLAHKYELNGIIGYLNWYYKYNTIGLQMNKLYYILINNLHLNYSNNETNKIILHNHIFGINKINKSIVYICKELNITFEEFLTNIQIRQNIKGIRLSVMDNIIYKMLLTKYSYLLSDFISIFEFTDILITYMERTNKTIEEYIHELTKHENKLYYNKMVVRMSIYYLCEHMDNLILYNDILYKLIKIYDVIN